MNQAQNMKAAGIIAEYNPFHKGHKYHLEQTLETTGADVLVCAMSGDFVQRGEPALLDKWTRAEMAVRNGIDLVCEIPTVFSCNNAGYFAGAGVQILENLGCTRLSFGCETDNIDLMETLSGFLKTFRDEIEEAVRKGVKSGLSYPRAREEAVFTVLEKTEAKNENGASDRIGNCGSAALLKAADRSDIKEILENPNNVLALEYMMNIENMKPVPVKRAGAGYNSMVVEEEEGNASATLIRYMLEENMPVDPLVTDETLQILNKCRGRFASSSMLFKPLVQKILTSSEEELNSIFGAEEGIGSILKRDVREWIGYTDMINAVKSKRYTRTRVNRVLVNTLLGIKREDVKNAGNFIRVLAFNEKGAGYLKEVTRSGCAAIPIVTNINKEKHRYPEIAYSLSKDILASDIYNLITGRDLYAESDFVKQPFRL